MTDESAGIGLGIIGLVTISIGAMFLHRRNVREDTADKSDPIIRSLRFVPFAALLIFMAKVGSYQNARQLAPYYVFFLPWLLVNPIWSQLVRRAWWQRLGLLVMAGTAILLVVERNRPLFPAETVIASLQTMRPQSQFLAKTLDSYTFWSSMKIQVTNPFKNELPPDEPVLGYAALVGVAEPGLWLPFGQRRVERLLPEEAPDALRQKQMRYVIMEEQYLDKVVKETLEQWLKQYDAEQISQLTYKYGPAGPMRRMYLVRLRSTPTSQATRAVQQPSI
jgi:hypothetical protein